MTHTEFSTVRLNVGERTLTALFQFAVHIARQLELAGTACGRDLESVQADLPTVSTGGGGVNRSRSVRILGDEISPTLLRTAYVMLLLRRAVDVAEARSRVLERKLLLELL